MSAITAIYTAAQTRGPVIPQDAVQLRVGCGIVGDRHYSENRRGKDSAATQLTLIEQEAVQAFNQRHGLAVSPSELRRNLVTSGVDLNSLVGLEFHVGEVHLRGIELCEPCSVIGKLLQQPGLSPAQVVHSLMGQGGLRAEILSTGVIRVGDTLRVPSTHVPLTKGND